MKNNVLFVAGMVNICVGFLPPIDAMSVLNFIMGALCLYAVWTHDD